MTTRDSAEADGGAGAAGGARAAYPQLTAFAAGLDFALDDFQVQACRAVEQGRGVLVAAPTGAGKTVVGEFAVQLALTTGRKAFYTTPIKALSNQKYADLVRRHGLAKVGLLTGDSSINGEAPVVVMTTEVLRNMMYAGSPTLRGLGYVVMDEVHYLADRFRGAVWEEVIIHLPEDVLVVSLSATVSNAEEFGQWLAQVRPGATEVVVSEVRPVPLWQHVLVGTQVYDLFVEEPDSAPGHPRVHPDLVARIRRDERRAGWDDGPRPGQGQGHGRGHGQGHGRVGRGPGGRDRPGERGGVARRADVIDALDRAGLLPAITFVFSRAGCDGAVGQLLAAGVRLVSEQEGAAIRRVVEERVMGLADEDLGVLGYWDFVDGLSNGYAAHHAGMLPTFREVVEELFTAGRIKAVFATETLALGINMPARTVVLEKLVKYNGETHADLTPAEYTQLTGRAGRRGIDVEGHAVVLWRRGLDPEAVAGLASTRTYPLHSSFRPTYNMAVNLVAQVGRDRARAVLETSFAQFQADRAVVGFVRALRRSEAQLSELADQLRCEAGDFTEYAALRAQLRDLEKSSAKADAAAARSEAAGSLQRLRIGDVLWVPAGRSAGWAVVVAPATAGRDGAPAVITADRQLRRLSAIDVPVPVAAVTQVTVPRHLNVRNPKARRDLAATLRVAVSSRDVPTDGRRRTRHTDAGEQREQEVARLRRELRAHPCHGCPEREEHARIAERWWRLRRETDGLARKVESRTNSVARTFDRICELLAARGYLSPSGEAITDAGAQLRRIYAERDLLVAECIRTEVWRRVDAAGLAACMSALVHEPRREAGELTPRLPGADVAQALEEMTEAWAQLEQQERRVGLTPGPPPEPGIAWMVHRWASGARLEVVLRGSDLAAGDFVRRCKQVVDLLGQIADVAPHPALATKARRAIDAVLRGVVAADRLD